jgi:hypothetical protein
MWYESNHAPKTRDLDLNREAHMDSKEAIEPTQHQALEHFFSELGGRVSEKNASLETQVRNFFSGVGFRVRLLAEYQSRIQRRLADAFNVFDWIEPNEPKLSAILAELLRPDGSHGQGSAFLCLWLNMIADELAQDATTGSKRSEAATHWRDLAKFEDRLNEARVVTESTTYLIERFLRRIDVRVDFARVNSLPEVVAIENKFGAMDQEDQVTDYAAQLKAENARFVLTYLSDAGSPSNSSVAEVKWQEFLDSGEAIAISYRVHISDWLGRCIQVCEAEKIRGFLRDFRAYIETKAPRSEPSLGDA